MYRDLNLTASLNGWHLFEARKGSKGFTDFAEKVFQRDGHACQFCGFQASSSMEIINLDGNYKNNTMDNMVTLALYSHPRCQF